MISMMTALFWWVSYFQTTVFFVQSNRSSCLSMVDGFHFAWRPEDSSSFLWLPGMLCQHLPASPDAPCDGVPSLPCLPFDPKFINQKRPMKEVDVVWYLKDLLTTLACTPSSKCRPLLGFNSKMWVGRGSKSPCRRTDFGWTVAFDWSWWAGQTLPAKTKLTLFFFIMCLGWGCHFMCAGTEMVIQLPGTGGTGFNLAILNPSRWTYGLLKHLEI